MPIFRVKSVKIYTGPKKNLHEYIRGVRDKYQVWSNEASQPSRLIIDNFQTLSRSLLVPGTQNYN